MISAPLGFLLEVTGRRIRDGAVRTFRFSNFPFTTTGSDTPADAFYDPRIEQAFDSSRSVFTPGSTSGRSVVQRGNVVLTNVDGALDDLQFYSFGGRAAVVRSGEQGGTLLADYPVSFVGTTEQPEISGRAVTFALRDAKAPFDANVQANKYAGTGGLEGGADLAGKPKPLLFGGPSSNVAPPLVHVLKEIYQVHDGAVLFVSWVRDQGAKLVNDGTYASEAELLDDALAPAFGRYKVYADGGYVRINTGGGAKQITMNPLQSGLSHAQMFQQVAYRVGLTDADLVLADFALLESLQLNAVEYWTGTTEIAAKDLCDKIAASAGCGWGARNSDGKIRLVRIDKPVGPAATTVTSRQMPKGTPIAQVPTADKERGKPVFSVRTDFQRNYTVQTSNDLLPSVSQDDREYFKQDVRSVVVADPSVLDTFLDAVELPITTLFTYDDPAREEAARVLALRKHFRFRFSVTVLYTAETAAIDLFDTVGVSATRFGLRIVGLGSGHPFLVLGVAPNAKARTITLDLWGNTLTLRNLITRSRRYLRTRSGDYLLTRGT